MNNIKKVFFTADWHVNHKNILKFSNRPFRNIEHMSQVLINNYNSTVPKDGICYFVGDIGMCSQEVLTKVLSQLNGTKVCILGNHDKGINAMYRMGFDVVLYGAKLMIANKEVTISHCPLLGLYREDTIGMKGSTDGENWHGEYKQRKYTFHNYGQFHLHGHIHSPNGGKSERICGRQMDVGVDANGYRPVSISKVESWIAVTG